MIREFPKDHELLSFFESEPTALDAAAPWLYNTLRFEIMRGAISVTTRIMGSYGEVDLHILGPGIEQTHELRNIEILRVVQEKGRDVLLAHFEDRRAMREFRLSLKPDVSTYFAMRDVDLP